MSVEIRCDKCKLLIATPVPQSQEHTMPFSVPNEPGCRNFAVTITVAFSRYNAVAAVCEHCARGATNDALRLMIHETRGPGGSRE